jgi:hypothetical protein
MGYIGPVIFQGQQRKRRGLCYDQHYVKAVTSTMILPDTPLCAMQWHILRPSYGKEVHMAEALKAVVWRLIEEVWHQGHLQVIDEIIAPTYVRHT